MHESIFASTIICVKNNNKYFKNQIMRKFTLFFSLLVSAATFAIDTYYVRPTGDATSWSTQATADPAQVLTITEISELRPYTPTGDGTTIGTGTIFYLAKGTYLATSTTINYQLDLHNGEKIYGGFAGNEETIVVANRELTDRDGNGIVEPWEFKNETILNGNFVSTRNSKRFLSLRLNAEADGLTLKDYGYTKGGTEMGSPIFVGAYAVPGQSAVTTAGILRNCAIVNVSAQGRGGAALMTHADSKIENCLFEQCLSIGQSASFDGFGGAVYVHYNGGQIRNSVFRNNKATSIGGRYGNGGAIFAESPPATTNSNAIIENCLFYNNSALGGTSTTNGYGGAIRTQGIVGYRGAQIINCTFVRNDNKSTTSGSVEVISSGIIANCIIWGGTKGFRANGTTANYYLVKCVSTVANLEMAADATAHPTVIFDEAADFGFARPTTFNGAIFPGETDYDIKIAEIRKANFSSSKASSYLKTNYGVASLPASYIATTGTSTVNITATLPTADLKGDIRVLDQNTLGAYNFVSDAVAPTVTISSTVIANATTSLGIIPFTVTFSEPVNGFDVSDIALTNATAADFVAVNSEVFTFNVSPVAVGAVTVNVSSTVATDFAGISNSAAAEYSVVSDFGTSVAKNRLDAANIFCTNGSLIFQNCTNQSVSIFTADAKLIKRFTINTESQKMSLTSGLYIVKVNDKFFKVVNR